MKERKKNEKKRCKIQEGYFTLPLVTFLPSTTARYVMGFSLQMGKTFVAIELIGYISPLFKCDSVMLDVPRSVTLFLFFVS